MVAASRRDGLRALLGAAAALGLSPLRAQDTLPQEGVHFVRLANPVASTAPAGKFELIEFFWYGCPHCAALEPAVAQWMTQMPADVAFRRVPVGFREVPYVAHQRLFYALESMGLLGTLHAKVFQAIHQDKQHLETPDEISAFVTHQGVDAARFMAVYQSFATQSKLTQAKHLTDDYAVDGVPSFGVHGRFFTSGTMAGSNEKAIAVAEWLLRRLRAGQ